MSYQVLLEEEGVKEVEEVLVNGLVFGGVMGIHQDGNRTDDEETVVQITHLPTGWGIHTPLPRSQAVKVIAGLLHLADWSGADPEYYKKGGGMKHCREVWLMISYCRGDLLPIGRLERLATHIESLLPKKLGGSSKRIEERRVERYTSECPSAVEVGDEACSVEI